MEKVVARNLGHLKKLVHEYMEKLGPNCDLNFIDVSDLYELDDLFSYPNQNFNGDISQWNVSNVRNMNGVFSNSKFNGDISKWDVSHVETMEFMFSDSEFNGDISGWDVSHARDMSNMFYRSEFNGDISSWNVSEKTDLNCMFCESQFKGNLEQWNITDPKQVRDMFDNSVLELEDRLPQWFVELASMDPDSCPDFNDDIDEMDKDADLPF